MQQDPYGAGSRAQPLGNVGRLEVFDVPQIEGFAGPLVQLFQAPVEKLAVSLELPGHRLVDRAQPLGQIGAEDEPVAGFPPPLFERLQAGNAQGPRYERLPPVVLAELAHQNDGHLLEHVFGAVEITQQRREIGRHNRLRLRPMYGEFFRRVHGSTQPAGVVRPGLVRRSAPLLLRHCISRRPQLVTRNSDCFAAHDETDGGEVWTRLRRRAKLGLCRENVWRRICVPLGEYVD